MRSAAALSEGFQKREQRVVRLERRNGVPTGKIFANAFSFTARFACKYRFLVSMLSRVPATTH